MPDQPSPGPRFQFRLRTMMIGVVKNGTGAVVGFPRNVVIGGKTGTAEVGIKGEAPDVWFVAWAPFSFIILALALAAPIAALMLMVKWPKVPEPENPLAKYKNDEVLE